MTSHARNIGLQGEAAVDQAKIEVEDRGPEAVDKSDCCSPAEQESCCEPAAKPGCCGTPTTGGCGCR